MKTFAFIFARGGSKGLPRKNILDFGGKPLIVHSIEVAKKVSQIEQVFVSTEDREISDISKENGAFVINRPVELASDNSPEWLSWQHAVEFVVEEFGDFERFGVFQQHRRLGILMNPNCSIYAKLTPTCIQ